MACARLKSDKRTFVDRTRAFLAAGPSYTESWWFAAAPLEEPVPLAARLAPGPRG